MYIRPLNTEADERLNSLAPNGVRTETGLYRIPNAQRHLFKGFLAGMDLHEDVHYTFELEA